MPVLDPIVLEVKSPAPKGLPGLDYASAKLSAMLSRLTHIQSLLNKPTEVRIVYKDAAAGLAAIKAKARELKQDFKSYTVADLSKMFGFDEGQLAAVAANNAKKVAKYLGKGELPVQQATGKFANNRVAGAVLSIASKERAQGAPISISDFLNRTMAPITQAAASAAATANAATATATAATSTAATKAATTAAAGSGAPPRGPTPPTPTRPFQGPPSGSPMLELREIIPVDANRNLTRIRKYITSVGETLKTYASVPQTGGPEEPQKEERVVSKVAPAMRELRASMADSQRQLLEMQSQAKATPAAVSALMRQMAVKLEKASKDLRAQGLGKDSDADRALNQSRRLLAQATKLDTATARQEETKVRQEAKASMEAVTARRSQAMARGDVGERVKLAQDLEDALARQGGALSPREAARVRGQIGRLRGTDQAKALLAQRGKALDAVADADAQLAGAMQRGGLDQVVARQQAANARRNALQSDSAATLTPRQRYRLEGQANRLDVQAEQGAKRETTENLRRRLEEASLQESTLAARQKGQRRPGSADAIRGLLQQHGDQLDILERKRWERRVAQIERNAEIARAGYAAEDRRDAERAGRGRAKVGGVAQKANDRRDQDAARLAAFEEQQRQASASNRAAQDLIGGELAAGGRIVRRKVDRGPKGASGLSVITERDTPDGLRRVSATFSDAGAKVTEFERALKATRAELGAAGRDFFRNTLTVAAWAASVGTLYGSLGLIRKGVVAFREMDMATARLSAVFRGSQGDVRGLIDDTLRFAAAEGRSSSEATDSAIRWARVGYTRGQILQAVEVSLKAANVAELTAAEATEKLMGVTAAYNLQARDLNDVLGMLNQTSNTWNVSNAEMLTGLTRTASVARQAGLPLAELIGILGAAIGTTGQTGANIGNAIKSVVTNMASPELQKRLREGFKFEVMMGEGDIASASDILRELFVSYQEFSNAQRQGLLYFAAGRTQASRLAAVMDSYVRSQVLAINAQLTLNSAEKENVRIRETLQNQMQGLVTEFERFSALQMASGPIGTALKSAVETLKNVFKLGAELTRAGGTTGAWVQTGLMGLAGVVTARMALTGVQMGKTGKAGGGAGNFLGNTWGRVAGAGVALGQTVDAMTSNFLMSRSGPYQKFGAETWTGKAVLGLEGKEKKLFDFGKARRAMADAGLVALQGDMTKVARGSQIMSITVNRSLEAMAITARGVLVGIRATLVAMSTVFLPMAIVFAAVAAGMYVFNRAMEHVGASIDGVSEKLAGLEQQADAAGHTAEAVQRGIQLTETVERALSKQEDPAARRGMLKELAEAKVFSPKTTAALQEAEKTGDTSGLDVLLKEERALLRIEGTLARAAQVRFEILRQSTAQLELDRLSAIEQRGGSWFGNEARQRNMAELSSQVSKSKQARIQLILDEGEAWKENAELRGKGQFAGAALKGTVEGRQSLFEGLTTSGEAGAGAARIAGMDAAIAKLEANKLALADAEERNATDQAEVDLRRVEMQKELVVLQAKLAKEEEVDLVQQGRDESGVTQPRDTAKRDEALRLVTDKEKAIELLAVNPTGRQEVARALSRDAEQQIEEVRAARAKEVELQPYRMKRDEWNLRTSMAQSDLGAENFGLDDGDRILRRLKAARDMVGDSERKRNLATTDEGRAAETVRELTAQHEIQVSLQEGQRTINDLKRQENQLIMDARREQERGLLTAGPTEMLRRVAAQRLGNAGVSGSQFFAASPEMRGALAQLFPEQFNPEVAQTRRARSRLEGDPQFQPDQLVAGLRENLLAQEVALQQLGASAANLALTESALATSQNLALVAVEAMTAATALAQLPAIVRQLVTNMTPGAGALPTNANPQAARPAAASGTL